MEFIIAELINKPENPEAVAAIYLYVKTARSSSSKIANDSSENNEPKSE